MDLTKDDAQFLKHFMDKPDFQQFVINSGFGVASRRKD